MKIGYIGLGLMGLPCARNILQHSYPLYVWARRSGSCTALQERGAIVCDSPRKVAEQVDIIFTNLPDAPDVANVLFGTDGIASSQKKGLIVVDMSTISVIKAREFATTLKGDGIIFVDAPVSGGTAGAEAGTLTFMVGADEDTFEKILPVLQTMGAKITRIGTSGAGQVAKSCNQICITANVLGVAEAIAFAQANGVDFAPVREALLGGFAASKVLDMHALRIMHNDYTPGFKAPLHLKDMTIITNIAQEQQLELPVAFMGTHFLQQAVDAGHVNEDSSILATMSPALKR